jgi:hypothetical protein
VLPGPWVGEYWHFLAFLGVSFWSSEDATVMKISTPKTESEGIVGERAPVRDWSRQTCACIPERQVYFKAEFPITHYKTGSQKIAHLMILSSHL